jgi:hypothetical protein
MPTLVIGHQGSNHVTSTQLARAFQGAYGKKVILPISGLNQLQPSVASTNTISIASGMGAFQGFVFLVPSGSTETVELDAGTAGMYRKDAIYLRFNRTSEGVESMQFLPLTGTEKSSLSACTVPSSGTSEKTILDNSTASTSWALFAVVTLKDGEAQSVTMDSNWVKIDSLSTIDTNMALAMQYNGANTNSVSMYSKNPGQSWTVPTQSYVEGKISALYNELYKTNNNLTAYNSQLNTIRSNAYNQAKALLIEYNRWNLVASFGPSSGTAMPCSDYSEYKELMLVIGDNTIADSKDYRIYGTTIIPYRHIAQAMNQSYDKGYFQCWISDEYYVGVNLITSTTIQAYTGSKTKWGFLYGRKVNPDSAAISVSAADVVSPSS